jgi:hypothetical protein
VRVNKRAYHLQSSIICGYPRFLTTKKRPHIGLRDVEEPTLSRQSVHRWRWGCQPCAGRALLPINIFCLFLVLISITDWVYPRAQFGWQVYVQWNNSKQSEVEPATFRLVAQCINHYATACESIVYGYNFWIWSPFPPLSKMTKMYSRCFRGNKTPPAVQWLLKANCAVDLAAYRDNWLFKLPLSALWDVAFRLFHSFPACNVRWRSKRHRTAVPAVVNPQQAYTLQHRPSDATRKSQQKFFHLKPQGRVSKKFFLTLSLAIKFTQIL